jgi:hypothetical protein
VRAVLLLLLAAVLNMAAGDGFGRDADAARGWYPSGIAAAGDSLSTGYGSDGSSGDHPRNSWSIGDNPAVASHYARVLRKWPRITGHVLLVARDGARVDALAGELARVVSHGDIDYVTIQIGPMSRAKLGKSFRAPPLSCKKRPCFQGLPSSGGRI